MANVLPLDDALEISALPASINQRAFRRPLGSTSKTAATRLHRGDARLRAFVLSCRRLSAIRQAVPIYGKGSLNDKGRSVLKAARVPQPDAKRGAPPSSATTPLNFKVPFDFRRKFKTYAAQDNKEMNQLLYEAFAALKARND